MEKDELAKIVAAAPHYPPPALFDEALLNQLAEHGARLAKRNKTRLLIALFVGTVIGFSSGLLSLPFLPTLLVVFAIALGVGTYKARLVQTAYKQRRYDRCLQLLPDTIIWNAAWYPFTYFQLVACQTIEMNILLLEGRALEFELVNRYLRAVQENKPVTSGIPKHWAFINNLGVAWLIQQKYKEAIEYFTAGLATKNLPAAYRLVMLSNLALCQARSAQLDAADAALKEAFEKLGKKTVSVAGSRLYFIKAIVEFQRDELEAAEKSIEDSQKFKGNTQEFCGAGMVLLARIRHKQGRLDEAELHFRNGMDIQIMAENPDYLSLAENQHYFAHLLFDLGKYDYAQRALERASSYYNFYVDRETVAVSNFRKRISDPKSIRCSTDLLTLTKRERFLETRDI